MTGAGRSAGGPLDPEGVGLRPAPPDGGDQRGPASGRVGPRTLTAQDHLDAAAVAFNELLNNVGTAMHPGRENPAQIEVCVEVMRRELAAYREARGE